MAKKTVTIIECENVVSANELVTTVKASCPYKVACGNMFVVSSLRCIKCKDEKKHTMTVTKAQAAEYGELADEV